jgi:hypothetical protein
MKRSGDGMKAVVNRALRLGLGMTAKPVEPTVADRVQGRAP